MTAPKSQTTEERALRYIRAFEASGRPVKRVVVDGRRLEFELEGGLVQTENDAPGLEPFNLRME